MKWKEICSHYPHQWLLIEAIEARSEQNKRILDEISVVETCLDSVSAMNGYKRLHRQAPERELYVFHTDRPQLDIIERRWLGGRFYADSRGKSDKGATVSSEQFTPRIHVEPFLNSS